MRGSVIPKRYVGLIEKIEAYLGQNKKTAPYRHVIGEASKRAYGPDSKKAKKYADTGHRAAETGETSLKVGDMLLRELRREVDIKKSKITFDSVKKIVQQYTAAVHNDARDDLVANRYSKLAEFLFERKSRFEGGPMAAAELANKYQNFARVVRGDIETVEAKKK